TFIIKSNIIYFLLIKFKIVIYSILASKVCSIVVSINIAYTTIMTLIIITNKLKVTSIFINIYTNFYFLWKYLVKLRII
ncbi:hypothetical protein LX36DRAFT_582988, partial [Colletotrichum falcatum]